MAQFVMLTTQLQAGDVVTETGIAGEHVNDRSRNVEIVKVEFGEIWYARARGFVPVMFVHGTDVKARRSVRWTVTNWRRWLVTRDIPVTTVSEMLSA